MNMIGFFFALTSNAVSYILSVACRSNYNNDAKTRMELAEIYEIMGPRAVRR